MGQYLVTGFPFQYCSAAVKLTFHTLHFGGFPPTQAAVRILRMTAGRGRVRPRSRQQIRERIKSLHGKTVVSVKTVFQSHLVSQLVTTEEGTPFIFVVNYCYVIVIQCHSPLMWFIEAKLTENIQTRVLCSFSCIH